MAADPAPPAPARSSMRLADGRRLVWIELGDPAGRPVLHCHGGLSSNLDVVPAHEAARRAGVRVIAPNRPGVGSSSRRPGRIMGDWASDVAELADHLDLDQFGVLGWSLGGGFAQAVAAGAGDRVEHLALVASTIPATWPGMTSEINRLDKLFMRLSGRGARIDRNLFRALRGLARRAPRALARSSHFPPAETDALIAAIAEGLRQAAGVLDEYRCMTAPWGFEPSDITVATSVWQGDADDLVPAGWGRRLAEAIDGATLYPVPGGTHFLAFDHWDEILGALST